VEFPLFAKLSARALECLATREEKEKKDVSAGDLRRMALACGRAQCFDSDLMEAMVPLIEESLQDFRPRDLVHVADAYARLPVPSPELFALVAEVLPRYLYDLRPPELATLCRSFAEVALYNEELMDALVGEVEKRARSFGAMECLIFLDGLSRLHEGMDEDLRVVRKERDAAVIAAVADQLSGSASSLAATDLVRGFSALVRLDYYNPRLIHGRICAGLSLKFDELLQGGRAGPPAFARPQQAARGFNALAELLHCLSLLPAQSHKSMELTTTTSQSMTQLLGQLLSLHQEDLERRGATAKDATASVGRLPDPHAVATAAVAVAQLGRVEQEEELMKCLVQCVTGAKNPGFLALASEEELKELQGAFELCNAMEVQEVIAAELQRRPMDVDSKG